MSTETPEPTGAPYVFAPDQLPARLRALADDDSYCRDEWSAAICRAAADQIEKPNDPMTWEYWRDRARLAESRLLNNEPRNTGVPPPAPGSAWSYDLTGPLRRENEELKRELEKHKRWVEYLSKEGAALRAGINARLNGEKCPETTWNANVEFAAKLECLVANNQDERPRPLG